jgi:TBC1 domain family member 15
MTIELHSTLAQAEVLFLSFSQIVADIDRRKVEQDAAGLPYEIRRRRRSNGASDGRGKVFTLPEISDNLRELLQHG